MVLWNRDHFRTRIALTDNTVAVNLGAVSMISSNVVTTQNETSRDSMLCGKVKAQLIQLNADSLQQPYAGAARDGDSVRRGACLRRIRDRGLCWLHKRKIERLLTITTLANRQ